MKFKRFIILIPQLFLLLLEALPYGVVLKYTPAPDPENFIRINTHYFDLTQFQYNVFMPFITGIFSIVILVLSIIWLITDQKKILVTVRILSLIQLFTGISVLLWGIRYVSAIGTIVNGFIIAQLVVFRMEKVTGEDTPRIAKNLLK